MTEKSLRTTDSEDLQITIIHEINHLYTTVLILL